MPMTVPRLHFSGIFKPPQMMTVTALRKRFRISSSLLYRIFPVNRAPARGIVDVDEVVSFLNAHAVGVVGRLSEPIQLFTESDIAHLLILDGHPATPVQVRRRCRRRLFPIPHFRFGVSVYRFPSGAVEWWLNEQRRGSPVVSRRFRVESLQMHSSSGNSTHFRNKIDFSSTRDKPSDASEKTPRAISQKTNHEELSYDEQRR